MDLSNYDGHSNPVWANYIGIDNIEFAEQGPVRFKLASALEPVDDPSRLLVVDLDRDEDDDLLVASGGSGGLVWLENVDGAEDYQAIELVPGTGPINDISLGDLDRNGQTDVIVASPSSVHWLRNLSSGQFDLHLLASAHLSVRSVSTGDIDRDGYLDVLVADGGDGSIHWYSSPGPPPADDSGWGAGQVVIATGSSRDASLADLDDDGDLDVMAVGATGPLAWYENTGALWTERVIEASVSGSQHVAVEDVDRNGTVDVLLTRCGPTATENISWCSNAIGSLPADGFDDETLIAESLSCPERVNTPDIDQDGKPDILVAQTGPGGSTIMLRQLEFQARFSPPVSLPVQLLPDGSPPSVEGPDAAVGDADGDGDPDVLSALSSGEISRSINRTQHHHSSLWWGGISINGFNKLLIDTEDPADRDSRRRFQRRRPDRPHDRQACGRYQDGGKLR